MISFINSWAKGIILAVVIATIIEIILPEGNNKKYVKTIIGIYIMFVMIYPLISKISNKNINVEGIIENTTSEMRKFETDNNIAIETNTYIEETYKQKLENDMREKTKEKGYEINSLDLYIETQNNESYGQINTIVMQISKTEKTDEDITTTDNNIIKNDVDNIQNVEIKILNNNTKNNNNIQNENISKEEIENLKDYFNSIYGVEKEKIYINE